MTWGCLSSLDRAKGQTFMVFFQEGNGRKGTGGTEGRRRLVERRFFIFKLNKGVKRWPRSRFNSNPAVMAEHVMAPWSEKLYKVLVIGNVHVGKSSIVLQYVKKQFPGGYRATVGVDFALKTIELEPRTVVRMQLWDIAGKCGVPAADGWTLTWHVMWEPFTCRKRKNFCLKVHMWVVKKNKKDLCVLLTIDY